MKCLKKQSVLIVVLLIFSFILISCTKRHRVYKIGVIGPFTGEGATYGTAMKRGIDLAIKNINDSGGINGKKLVAIYEDSKLLPSEGVNAFNKLVNIDKVPVIIGAAASSVTLAIAPLAQKDKIVLISPISTSDSLRHIGDFIFRDVPPNSIQGKTAAYFIFYKLNRKKVAIFFKNNEYGIDLTKSFEQYFKKLGGIILLKDSYNPGERNFKNKLLKIKNVHPEVVYFPGNYQESALILKQAKEIGLDAIFVGGDGSYSPELIKIAGKAAEGSYYTLMALPIQKNDKLKQFIKKYKEVYGQMPGIYDTYSYDALNIIAEAIKNVGYDAEKIKNYLHRHVFYGVTGKIKFTKYGDVDKPYAIYVVRNGKFVRLKWRPVWEKGSDN